MKRLLKGLLLIVCIGGSGILAEGYYYPATDPGYGPGHINWPPPGGNYRVDPYYEAYPAYPAGLSRRWDYGGMGGYDYYPYADYSYEYLQQPDWSGYSYDYEYSVPAPNSFRPDPAYDYGGYYDERPAVLPPAYEIAPEYRPYPEQPEPEDRGEVNAPEVSPGQSMTDPELPYSTELDPGYPIEVVPPPNMPYMDYTDIPPPPPAADWRPAKEMQSIESLPELPSVSMPAIEYTDMPPPPPPPDWRPAREMELIESLPESTRSAPSGVDSQEH